MRNFFLIFFILFSFGLYAQDFEIGMNVTKSDLLTNVYDKDSTANGLVVYEYGYSYFSTNTYKLTTKIKRKVKILSKEGLKNATVEIILRKNSRDKEKIKDLKGSSFELIENKLNETKLTKESIFQEEYNPRIDIVKFLIPNAKVGSIITYSYTIESPFMNNFKAWYFQENIPKLYSEYNTSIPGNWEYNIRLIGNQKLDFKESGVKKHCLSIGNGSFANCAEAKYVMKNVPAYIEEGFTTSKNNYLSKIEYNLSVFRRFDGYVDKISKTWKDADFELQTDENFGQLVGKQNYTKNIVPQKILGISDDLKRAKAIYQYIIDNYKWDESSGRYNASVKRLLKNKIGNAFELNLLLQNVLSHNDFDVNPILTATRSYGFPTKIYPIIDEFNYMILVILIDGKSFFLDATDPYLSFGELPFRALNHYGRLYNIETKNTRWQDISINRLSLNQVKAKLKLEDNFNIVGNIENKKTGYLSHSIRKEYDNNPLEYLNKLKNSNERVTISNHKKINKNKNDFEFIETMDIKLEEDFIDNKLYFNPFFIQFFSENPFKLSQRTYPIDFGYKQMYFYSIEIDIGDKLEVLELPKNKRFSLPNRTGSILFSSTEQNNKITVFFKLKFNKTIYSPEYYNVLKEFMSKVVEIQNNTVIVLEKK
ncbi:uncharacterized protein DUF3857 [Winogradskyella wandonensis]|uniref:Uncharacterized protein DUF3857 n=1 Tax=Winogradskyella wandonensis TaxID=1442586 RepID=A0A4R1KIJ9_9FLAO|nr:DUF3858 domain-containing protein [Winogradskyella wandonensis]TCK64698.1 uncharacterized protein DUF3857 [Winogradskyella wandonensis]